MDKISVCIFRHDNIHYLIHIEQNSILCGHIVVIIMTMDKVLDFENAFSIGLRLGE
jgi:hypothetical protein